MKKNSSPHIYILTGPIRSGKTTSLYHWTRSQESVGGFLTPDMDGLRYLHLLGDRSWHAFETKDETLSASLTKVGRYCFYTGAFDRMEGILVSDVSVGKRWIIIDELGKLELKGRGLANVARRVIESFKNSDNPSQLILVIRDELLEELLDFFELRNHCKVILSEDLTTLS